MTLQVIDFVQHPVVHLVDLARHVIAVAWFVQQKGDIVTSGDYQRHLFSRGSIAPVFGISIGGVLEQLVVHFTPLHAAVDKQFLKHSTLELVGREAVIRSKIICFLITTFRRIGTKTGWWAKTSRCNE